MMAASELRTGLAGCIGATTYYKHWMGGITYTDGVQLLAEGASAYWLIDAIASYQADKRVRELEFQAWHLRLEKHGASWSHGWLSLEDGNGNEILSQEIPSTDFPLTEGIELWVENKVLYLPSEH